MKIKTVTHRITKVKRDVTAMKPDHTHTHTHTNTQHIHKHIIKPRSLIRGKINSLDQIEVQAMVTRWLKEVFSLISGHFTNIQVTNRQCVLPIRNTEKK